MNENAYSLSNDSFERKENDIKDVKISANLNSVFMRCSRNKLLLLVHKNVTHGDNNIGGKAVCLHLPIPFLAHIENHSALITLNPKCQTPIARVAPNT